MATPIYQNPKKERKKVNLMSMELGTKVKFLMKEQGITQRALANEIGISPATVNRYVSGNREPSASLIKAFATILHTTPNYLLGVQSDNELLTTKSVFDTPAIKNFLLENRTLLSKSEKLLLVNAILFGEEPLKEDSGRE